jgi:hypothetical protein
MTWLIKIVELVIGAAFVVMVLSVAMFMLANAIAFILELVIEIRSRMGRTR